MGLHDSFADLSRIVEQLEERGQSVGSVEATTDDTNGLSVTMDLPVSLGDEGNLTPQSAQTTGSSLQVAFDDGVTESIRSVLTSSVTVCGRTARVTDGGDLVVTVVLSFTSSGETESTPESTDPDATESEPAGPNTVAADSSGSVLDRETGSQDVPSGDTAESTDDDTTDSADSTDLFAARRDESVPPYEDVPYLELLYESCDTFAEMSDHIELDVASETVRRYMIDAGVHDPDRYDTNADSADESGRDHPDTAPDQHGPADQPCDEALGREDGEASPTEAVHGTDTDGADLDGESEDSAATTDPSSGDDAAPTEQFSNVSPTPDAVASLPEDTLVTDGLGLPADARVEDIVDAVVDSSTVYEVGRRLEVDGQVAWDVLQQLNVLDLVLCRVSGPDRDVTPEDVTARIREATPTRHGQSGQSASG